jgi:hypothetical protein
VGGEQLDLALGIVLTIWSLWPITHTIRPAKPK